jgi:hypothetical protein
MGAPPARSPAASMSAPDGQGMGQLLAQQQQASADMQQKLESATRRFRDLLGETDSLAKGFPQAAQELRQAQEGLKKAMMKVTQLLTAQQPQGASWA